MLKILKTIIFDLDGTLIDSAPSILASMEYALKTVGISPKVPLNTDLIGPPLSQVFERLIGKQPQQIEKLIEVFKNYYDATACQSAKPYDGIETLLDALAKKSTKLCIATNKRYIPTSKILLQHGWNQIFSRVYTMENPYHAQAINKYTLLQLLISDERINPIDAFYIGDRSDDYHAAQENKIPFIYAQWGYGTQDQITTQNLRAAINPDALENILFRHL